MGYETWVSGNINCYRIKDVDTVKKILTDFCHWDNLESKGHNITFSDAIYTSDIKPLNVLAKYCYGEIILEGEERWDNRRIDLENGTFSIKEGHVIYGDIIDYVIDNYDMPNEIKQQLRQVQVVNML